ncbi:hypothetical protein V7659_17735 [Neobacillus drentensis]|uniref:hypothetical protein n=1 Tax=Neobacillus drentensis TaxID=220684 RepID=UPI002FFD970C
MILEEVRQSTESSNVARVAALRAGVPDTTTAFTIKYLMKMSIPDQTLRLNH